MVFLAAYAWKVIGQISGTFGTILNWVIIAVWVIFVLDYVVSLVLARPRWRWFYTHLLDLLTAVLPIFRPLRLLKFVTLVKALRLTPGSTLRGRIVLYLVSTVTILVFVGALAVLSVERGKPGSDIETFGTAIWWAIVTMTTVGYGDLYPVTMLGRLIAIPIMIGGITLVGVVTGTLASWITERTRRDDEGNRAATRQQINELEQKIDRLVERLNAQENAEMSVAASAASSSVEPVALTQSPSPEEQRPRVAEG